MPEDATSIPAQASPPLRTQDGTSITTFGGTRIDEGPIPSGCIRRHIRHSVAPPESGKATPWRNSATLKLTGIAELTRLPSGGAHEVVLWQLAVQEEAVDGCGDALVAADVGDMGITVPGQQLGGVELLG